MVGRSRALEIVLSGDDFDADIAERHGWVNRALDDDDLDSFVDTLAGRLTSFDRETLAAAKARSIDNAAYMAAEHSGFSIKSCAEPGRPPRVLSQVR